MSVWQPAGRRAELGILLAGLVAPVISIVAERDTVMVSTQRKVRDRANPDHIYYMTWFDVFRIDEHGLIAEHWDPSEMWVNGRPPGAEFFHEWEDSMPGAGSLAPGPTG